MCSFTWHKFEQHIGIVFNRDESILRSKAVLPEVYFEHGTQFIMPRDPDGQGSWIAANEYGFVFVLLNDYQGQLKTTSDLISRGQLIRTLASCQNLTQVSQVVDNWPLERSQPFQLGVISHKVQWFWHNSGLSNKLKPQPLPTSLFSSGHPEAKRITSRRRQFIGDRPLKSISDLELLYKSHEPCDPSTPSNGGDTYSLCMHRPEAHTQSLSAIMLGQGNKRGKDVLFRYWDGQPCQVDRPNEVRLELVDRQV